MTRIAQTVERSPDELPDPGTHKSVMSNPNIKVDDTEAKRRLIAEIAYFTAERRGFSPGYEIDDWLEAEQDVEASLEALD
jgi:hypothetical protein